MINKKYYDESEIFKTNSLKATYEDSLVRYALYEYIYKFGYPKSDIQRESYNYWKRYVYNIVKIQNSVDVQKIFAMRWLPLENGTFF